MDHDMMYIEALSVVDDLECRGINPYTLCVAIELSKAIKDVKKALRRSRTSLKRLSEDVGLLFSLALDAYNSSCGASTPAESVSGVIEGYLENGMNINEVRSMVECPEFMAKIADDLNRKIKDMKSKMCSGDEHRDENLTLSDRLGIIFPLNKIERKI